MVHFDRPPDLAINATIGADLGWNVVDTDAPAQSAGWYGTKRYVVFTHILDYQMITLFNCLFEAKSKELRAERKSLGSRVAGSYIFQYL
jgi:hypothetical protein